MDIAFTEEKGIVNFMESRGNNVELQPFVYCYHFLLLVKWDIVYMLIHNK